MRQPSNRSAIIVGAAMASLLVGASSLATAGERTRDTGQRRGDAAEMRAHEESRQSYQLDSDAQVRVTGIAGPVSIETGGDSFDLRIDRMAASERELQCYATRVTASDDSLSIEHVQFSERPGCDSIRSRQEVRLRVPRTANVHLSTIAGRVDIGALDGRLRLDSIAGHVTVARAGTVEVDSLAGGLSLGLAPIGPEGVRISSVVGPVELSFGRDVDADISVDSVMGSVRSLSPGLDLVEEEGAYRARAGSGGGRVRISSVMGSVRLRRP